MVVDDSFAAYGAEQSVIYTPNAGEFVIETQGALIIHIFFPWSRTTAVFTPAFASQKCIISEPSFRHGFSGL